MSAVEILTGLWLSTMFVSLIDSEVDSQHHSHKDKPHSVGTDILVRDNSRNKGTHVANVTNTTNTEVPETGENNKS